MSGAASGAGARGLGRLGGLGIGRPGYHGSGRQTPRGQGVDMMRDAELAVVEFLYFR